MKKMQCEVCGSNDIKKVSDGIFECQSCGTQYSAEEARSLLIEVTGKVKIDHSEEVENNIKRAQQYEGVGNDTKATEYYNAALDMDADNEIAQQRVKELTEQQELGDYYLVEPDVDPQENVKNFLAQLATTENIACDIYKEIAIKSVTEKYMTFYFMKAQYRADWTAIACYRYYENQTVYKDRYDYQLKRTVKEPVTEKVERINRVPQSGTHSYSGEELVLASENLKKLFGIESETAKQSLITAFERQQDSKYGTYDVKRINTRDLRKEDGKFAYKGLALDENVDVRIYADKKKRMASAADSRAETEIKNGIAGDFWENFKANIRTVSESVARVCIPVQIIEYTYKGKNYAALSDLLSYTTTMPLIYPCDTELATEMERLESQKEESAKTPGFKAGLIIMGIGVALVLIFALLPDLGEIFGPISLGLMVFGLIVLLVGVIIQRSREKKFKNSASDIKRTMFDPRVSALETTKKQFFEEYTDYASAQNAAANADCLDIKKTSPELSDAGAFRQKISFITNEFDTDEEVAVLEKGVKEIQKKRTIGSLLALLIGALVCALGIIVQSEADYLHGITFVVLLVTTIGGFMLASIGSVTIIGVMNGRIKQLRGAIQAHKTRKQIEDDPEKAQEISQLVSYQMSVWTEERIAEAIEQLGKQVDKSIPKKQRLHDWVKKHKILLAIICGVALLALLPIAIEAIVCSVQTKPYEQGLVGRTFEHQHESSYYSGTVVYSTYHFEENNKVKRSGTEIDSDTSQITDSYEYVEKYQIHYDMFTGEMTLILTGSSCEVEFTDDGANISSFEKWGNTYYEVKVRE